jgi:hypothetical protein
MRALLPLVVLVPLLGCGGTAGAGDARPGAAPRDAGPADAAPWDAGPADAAPRDAGSADAPGRPLSFTRSDALFPNPERGFYRAADLLAESDLSWLRSEHPADSLVHSYVRLDAFRDRDIDAATLASLERALGVARAAGFEVILRFAYNEGPYPDSEPDAPLARIQAHLAQLAPILRANADVIAVVQAGFIGAWGEWHTSTNGLDRDPDARRAVVEAVLAALPSHRSTQLRYPPHIAELLGGAPLDETRAFAGTFASRIGFHNDCFVASETDFGTYPSAEIARWRDFASAHSAYSPAGGETCSPFPARSACAPAVAELEAMHFSYINRDYHPDVIAGWERGGCLGEIERRLGYRLVLTDGELPEAVRPGGSFRVRLALRNEGFAGPFNPRPALLAIEGPGGRASVELPIEVRAWLPGTHAIDVRLALPGTLAEGTYTLSLALPSGDASLAARPEFSIRLANEGVWDAARGQNTLTTFRVDDAAPGARDPSGVGLRVR